ncbi:Histidine kinase-like ATPase, ATP-binding domain-containing protein [Artemisia annua]|uniref:Histidine kinase-like ATPase, ATP-binding domain-containing protein n=1 Tax=Artemisia annua TaxID=35608 RepID=A0A2U1KY25_ARTAN|nr:Histidine kinase-like ATPase, ATP-binding domain-containing protein [Artemisia annua]
MARESLYTIYGKMKMDICITWDGKGTLKEGSRKAASEQHIANRLRYSLRAYLSVLYLKLPDTFSMLLRGEVIVYHNIATDLKHTEYIVYKPYNDGGRSGNNDRVFKGGSKCERSWLLHLPQESFDTGDFRYYFSLNLGNLF